MLKYFVLLSCFIVYTIAVPEKVHFMRTLQGENPSISCSEGLKHTKCGDPQVCQRTCANPTGCQTSIQVCTEGCVCPQGTVLSEWSTTSKCIPVEDCSKTCNPLPESECKQAPCRWNRSVGVCKMRTGLRDSYNEPVLCEEPTKSFRRRGTNCPLLCNRKQTTSDNCRKLRGCQCKRGEYFDRSHNRCYVDKECTTFANGVKSVGEDHLPVCESALQWTDCGTCRKWCDSSENQTPEICTGECRRGCFCPDDMPFQNDNNECFTTKACDV